MPPGSGIRPPSCPITYAKISDPNGGTDPNAANAAAADVLGVHPALAERPRAECEPARATGRDEHVRGLLSQREVVGEGPAHLRAEDVSERDDVSQARRELEYRRQRDPTAVGVLQQ